MKKKGNILWNQFHLLPAKVVVFMNFVSRKSVFDLICYSNFISWYVWPYTWFHGFSLNHVWCSAKQVSYVQVALTKQKDHVDFIKFQYENGEFEVYIISWSCVLVAFWLFWNDFSGISRASGHLTVNNRLWFDFSISLICSVKLICIFFSILRKL